MDTLIAASFFLALFEGMRAFLVRFRGYSDQQALPFCSRFVATVHSLIVGVIASYDVFLEPRYEMAGTPHFLAVQSAGAYLAYPTCCAYLLYDLYPQLYHKATIGGSLEMVIHHLLGIPGLIYAMHSGVCGFWVSQMLCFEISTPFLHALWFLPLFGVPHNSLGFKLAGAGFVISFFVFRVLGSLFILFSVFSYSQEIKALGGVAWLFASWTTAAYTILNLNWFYRVLVELTKFTKAPSAIQVAGG
ncbi:MAG: TLC domain-containing protein [archaeon]|nr:TLC domain-containing protein [archaeon]